MKKITGAVLFGLLLLGWATAQADEAWQPAKGPLTTKWAKDLSPDSVLQEYPRPQLRRQRWLNLNGLWDYAITSKDAGQPEQWEGKILVPFPVESALSGVMKRVGDGQRLWYRRTFSIPDDWNGQRILLNFEAADWKATAWVNGQQVGEHRGGYDPFTFDVTQALKAGKQQELVVAVDDPTDAGTQPRGKQIRNPHGIWYTPVTGIWQTVWLEPVNRVAVDDLTIVPDIDNDQVRITVAVSGATDRTRISATAFDGDRQVAEATGGADDPLVLTIPDSKLWSPQKPFLYDLKVRVTDPQNQAADEVESYFGMRKIALGKDDDGIVRLFLNNEPLFQYGLLDQGWWPDGLYTAPSDEALKYDIEKTKEWGFNMIRKHVKVEPRRWYYWTDRLGLLVWQDMPNGDRHIGAQDPDIERSAASIEQYETEWKRIIDALYNHPSIVMWVPFNEGWGQFDTARITELTRNLDSTRLVNSASGWTDRGTGDVHDVHIYPGPGMPELESDRAAVLGEFGGLGLPVSAHTWQDEKNWGYRSYKTREELTQAYQQLIHDLRPLIAKGLAAAVYTQTTDVEIEVNGLMTYDRAVTKIDPKVLAKLHRPLYLPPPQVKTLVPTSQQQGISWRYRTKQPREGWQEPEFDDSTWQKGPGGFGTSGTPGATVRTNWSSPDIWMRRTFKLEDGKLHSPHLLLHHDEDAEIYINGELVANPTGYTVGYVLVPLDEEDQDALKQGTNTIAIHCHQTGGGQYIDVGLVDVIEQPAPAPKK